MQFTSFAFVLFLPIVFGLYWALGSSRFKAQNLLLVVASLTFYGWWDYRFVLLLLATTSFDYLVGLQLSRIHQENRRRLFFIASILTNLCALGLFKYFNFFSENFARLLNAAGWHTDTISLNVILPIGISFYTFHSMSYVIDVYHRRKETCRDPVAFFAFISFFPLLVAGPIVRASWFLPQFQSQRDFEEPQAADGLRQMLWGFFKKMVVADGCAHFVNGIFDQWSTQSAATLAAGAVLFAFQIYGDFSGYSDIAIGTARLFGFRLQPNFRYPYFSRDIAEFWRRWHISLSSWFRDYVYIPLGGSREGSFKAVRNTLFVFLLSGFWHGASWTFLFWGALHALFFMPLLVLRKNRLHVDIVAPGRLLPAPKDALMMLATFLMVSLAWIFFRAANLDSAFGYIQRMFSTSWGIVAVERRLWLFIGMMLVVEWLNRNRMHGLSLERVRFRWLRWCIYTWIFLMTFFFGAEEQTFIYFQF